jgi:hypothetical protein
LQASDINVPASRIIADHSHANPHAAMAAQCINAVHLAVDPARLQQAPDRELVTAAATLAKGLVLAGLHR